MATRKITTKIELEGAPAYAQAVKDCNAELKLLNSEQKLIEAQFKATGDQEQYAADMTELLQKKIAAQQTVVEAAKAAIQELTDKGGENSTQMDEWKIKLNNAETSLTKLNTQLTNVTTGSGDMKTKTEAATTALEEHKTAIDNASDALADLDQDESDLIGTLDKWSDSLDSLTGGMDFKALNESLDNLKTVFGDSEAISSLQTMTSSITAVQESAQGAIGFVKTLLTDPTAAATFGAALAVTAVMNLVTALDEAAKERDFGWTSELSNLNAGIGAEGKKAIRDGIRDSIADGIKEASIQDTIDSEIGKGYKQAAFNLVTGSAGALASDKERGVALAYVTDTYKTTVTAAEDEYRDALIAYNKAVQEAGDDADAQAAAETALAEALERKNAALAEANRLRTEQLGQLLGSAGDLTAMEESLSRAGSIGAAMEYINSGENSIYDFDNGGNFNEEFEKMLIAAGYDPSQLQGMFASDILSMLNEGLEEAMKEADTQIGENSPMLGYWQAMLDSGALQGLDYSEASGAILAGLRASLLLSAAGEDGKLDISEILDTVNSDEYKNLGADAAAGYTEGIDEGAGDAADAAEQMATDSVDAAKAALDEHSPSRVMKTLGENAAVGLANGIYAKGGDVAAAARWLANLVTSTVQSSLQIHSPSRVFESLGEMTGLGFAEGIEGSAGRISRAVSSMVGAVTRQPASIIGSAYAGGSAPGVHGASGHIPAAGTVHVTMILDEEVLGDVLAPIVNAKIGAEISAVRR